MGRSSVGKLTADKSFEAVKYQEDESIFTSFDVVDWHKMKS